MNVTGFLKRKLFVSVAVWILLSALAVTTICSADGPISIKITDAYFETNEEDNIINEKYLVFNYKIFVFYISFPKFLSICKPVSPLFSGWNCAP